MKWLFASAVCAVALVGSSAHASFFLGGNYVIDDVLPQAGISTYQQVYEFGRTSSFLIQSVQFGSPSRRGMMWQGDVLDNSGVRLYYTNRSPGELSLNPADNIGDALEIGYSKGRVGLMYNASKGNLLLVSGSLAGEHALVLNPQRWWPPHQVWGSRMYVIDGEAFSDSRAIATGFRTVPEPSSWALMIGGFGFAGSALRRRPRRPEALQPQ